MNNTMDSNLEVPLQNFSEIEDIKYIGNFDKNKLKTGAGDLKWNEKHQQYRGQFFQDCLHGRGRYNWFKDDESFAFQGNFYANKLEGYGKYFYNDCQVFQGLFKDNERFGPGVFTYKDGSQDVGMWNGKNLIRLCRVINAEWIPRIAQTPVCKVQLLKHKKLVSICNETSDKAQNILQMLEVHEEVMEQSEKLYNIHIRNAKSNFFNAKLYETRYFCEKDCYIEVALTPSEIKIYYDERENIQNNVSQDEIILEEASQNKSCCEEVPSDVVCVCENPKQVRIKNIILELQRIDTAMNNAQWKVRIAKCRKRFARKREKEKRITKKIIQKAVGMQSPSGENEFISTKSKSTNTKISFGENDMYEDYIGEEEVNEESEEYDMHEEYDMIDDYEELTDEEDDDDDDDDDIIEDDGTDYKTACQLLIKAKRSLEMLFIKKLKLTDQLNLEYLEFEENDEEECSTTQLTKRVLITDLLAWNNEELSIDIMKHAFLHRNFENSVPFCVSDILCGDRSSFNKIGIYEESCGTFLTECSNGNCQEALHIFYTYDLNPDLCDSRGNTGIIYAASRDKIKMIKILINLGANVDSLNDECCTPLGICMLRYLAIQHKVTDWEKAFLKYVNLENNEETYLRFEWRPHVSLVSLNSVQQLNENYSGENVQNVLHNRASRRISHLARLELLSEIFGSNLDLIHSNNFIESIMDIDYRLSNIKSSYPEVQERFVHKTDDKEIQNYLFLTDCIKPPPEKKSKIEKKAKKGKKEKKAKKEKKKSDKGSKASSKKNKKNKPPLNEARRISLPSLTIIEVSPEDIILNNKLNSIYNTIVELLTSGANPNFCEVPQPTLILSLFTKNVTLVEQLLMNKANPNVATHDENLSALHILVSVPPSIEIVDILKLILNYSADPNFKASQSHWLKEKQELIGKRQLIEEDQGKTPLHLLCMRYDFKFDIKKYLNDMALELIKNGFDSKELYLGHTPLSIAMLRGNVELIKTMLESRLINPNQRLGENMGFSLTLFILKRYSDKLPDFQICCDIIELLIKCKANPFKQSLNIGNVIEFMIKEHEPPPSTKTGSNKNKKGKSKPQKKKKDKKGKKGKGKVKGKSTQEQVKEVLMSFSKSVLERHLKGWIVKYLFSFVRQQHYYDEISETLATFVNVDETIKIAQLLFNRGRIKPNESNYETLHDLIEMIINSNSKKVNENIFPSSQVNIHELIENFQFKKIHNEKGKINLSEPETIKHNEYYNVCYQCLRKQERQLFACPKCKLIYFCSQECNKLNLKVKNSFHKCGTLFYKEQELLYLPTKRLQQPELQQPAKPEQSEQKPTNNEEISFGPTKREIKEDKSKLLHLGRHAKKCASMTGLIFLSESDADLKKVLNEKFGIPRSKSIEPSIKYPTKKLDKFSKKKEHGGINGRSGREFGDADHLKRSKSKSSKKTTSSDDGEEKKTKYGTAGKKSKSPKQKSEHDEKLGGNKTDGHGKDKKNKRGKGNADGHGDDETDGKERKGKFAKGLNKGVSSNENKTGKLDHIGFSINKEKIGKTITKENFGGKSEKGYGRDKSPFTNKEKVMQQTGQSRNTDGKEKFDQLGLIGIENYELMSGGKELELQRRLPQQYQHFLEKISEYWPDFDISMLFLPYACYRDGQLYYRFLTKQPIFMETYSTT